MTSQPGCSCSICDEDTSLTDKEKLDLIKEWMHPGMWSALDGRRECILRIINGEKLVPPRHLLADVEYD